MVDRSAVRADMQVLGSDGGLIGRVAGMADKRLRIKGSPGAEDEELYEVPESWVIRTDEHVHLDRQAALVREQWTPAGKADIRTPPASSGHRGALETGLSKGKSRLPWILIAIGIVIALFLLVRGLTYAVVPGPGTDQTHPAAEGASEVAPQ